MKPEAVARLTLLSIGMLLVATCASKPATNSTVSVPTGWLRSTGAAHVTLAAYGRKLPNGDFDSFRVLWPGKSLQTKTTLFDVDETNSVELKKAGVNFEKIAAITMSGGRQTTEKYALAFTTLTELSQVVSDLREMAERDPNMLDEIGGSDFRLVTAVATVSKYELARSLSGGVTLDATVTTGGAGLTTIGVDASAANKLLMKIGDDAVVGYQLSRFCWDTHGRLHTVMRDLKGKDQCPAGTTSSRPQAAK